MSTLHEQLLAATEPRIAGTVLTSATVNAPLAALRAVVELHAPRPCTGMAELCAHLDPHNVCTTCGAADHYVIGDPDSTARCSTIQAIARELGVPTEGDDRG